MKFPPAEAGNRENPGAPAQDGLPVLHRGEDKAPARRERGWVAGLAGKAQSVIDGNVVVENPVVACVPGEFRIAGGEASAGRPRPIREAATQGGVVAVMCSYNRLNDVYASANDWLLNQVLKKEWAFKGLVMSDWGASHATTDVANGLDLEMSSGVDLNLPKIQAAIADGTVSATNVDNAVHRILRTFLRKAGWTRVGNQ